MTDPWEGKLPKVRTGHAVKFNEQAWAYYSDGVKELRADANALLAVAPYAYHKLDCNIGKFGGVGDCTCGYDDALAALPEHLK